jgi:two-component system, LuxR family, response regulator FixJ
MTGLTPRPVVAVVEDDASTRTALGRLLRATGFEPVLFESAEAYLAASPTTLCLILDVRLPGMSGLELQQRLQAAGTGPPIIVTTANHEVAVRERALQNACVGFFWKPVDGTLLIAAIQALVEHRHEVP